jgi:hypothetical protein
MQKTVQRGFIPSDKLVDNGKIDLVFILEYYFQINHSCFDVTCQFAMPEQIIQHNEVKIISGVANKTKTITDSTPKSSINDCPAYPCKLEYQTPVQFSGITSKLEP